MVEDRKLAVLRAIVEDYVSTQEPVGSKALVDRHRLGVSPATVRNDMAALEEEGFITQPHTSAGRIPTDKGYRLFVDRLSQVKPLNAAEKRAIATLLEGAIDLDDVVQRSVRLLAQLTRQVAIVQYPTLSRSTVRHVEVVPLTAARVLVVLILSTGRVEQRVVELPGPLDEDRIADLRGRLQPDRSSANGSPMPRRPGRCCPTSTNPTSAGRWRCSSRPSSRRCPTTAPTSASSSAAPPTSPASATGSTSPIRPMLEALEEHVVLLKLLGEASSPSTVTVRIGHEGPYQELASTSVVATGYGPGDEALATLGIVGPTRMDYPGSMAAVRAVARYVSRILDEG